jgi:hypothetical protein
MIIVDIIFTVINTSDKSIWDVIRQVTRGTGDQAS